MQEEPQPVELEAEIVSGGSEDGIDGIALSSGKIITAHAVSVLDVADDQFDGGTSLHLTLDGGCHPSLLP